MAILSFFGSGINVKAEDDITWIRLAGSNRYETMAAILDEAFNENTELAKVYLTSGNNYTDALTAVNLLEKNKSVLLLANYDSESSKKATNKVLDRVLEENKDSINKAYIFGGTTVMPEELEDYLNNKY